VECVRIYVSISHRPKKHGEIYTEESLERVRGFPRSNSYLNSRDSRDKQRHTGAVQLNTGNIISKLICYRAEGYNKETVPCAYFDILHHSEVPPNLIYRLKHFGCDQGFLLFFLLVVYVEF